MEKFSIFKDSTVIVQRNGKIFCLHICDVKKGDLIKGYDLNNNKECWNTVVNIEYIKVPKEEQVRFWWKIPTFRENFIILSETGNIDCWTYNDNLPWAYKAIKDVKVGDYLKGSVEVDNNKYRADVFAVDENCDYEEDFVALTVTNSYNFYARAHDSSADPNVETDRNKDMAEKKEAAKHIEGYTKEFEDFILVRANRPS